MEIPDREALGQFVRTHHVHYEVEPEVVGERREVVAFDVRLFATPAESKLAAPASAPSVELLGELRSFAERLVSSGDAEHRMEVVPASPALYESPDVPDVDEVALTVRVHCDSPGHRQSGAGEGRCLGAIRQRLEAVGVARR